MIAESPPIAEPTARLYSARAIAVASALSSLLGGAVLLSYNYVRLRRRRAAISGITGGIAAVSGLNLALLESPKIVHLGVVAAVPLTVLQALTAYVVAVRLQGEELARHKAAGGSFQSGVRVALAALLVMPAYFAVLLLLAFAVAALKHATG